MIEKQFCNDKVRILYIADQRCNHDWQKMVRISIRNVIYVFLTVVGIIYIYYLNNLGPKNPGDETQLRTTSDGSKFDDLPCVLNIIFLSSLQFRLNYRAAVSCITWNISPSFCVHLVFLLLRIALKAMLCCEDSVCYHTVTTEAGDVQVQLNI